MQPQLSIMSRPQRSTTIKPGVTHRMLTWDQVDMENFSLEDDDDSSTEFGSDDIYMSDPVQDDELQPDVDHSDYDGVIEEDLTVPEQLKSFIAQETVEENLERDFTRNFEERIGKRGNTNDWSFSFQEEFQEDIREVTGVGLARKRKSRRKSGAPVGPRLSAEAQQAFGDANMAFVSGQTEEALRLFQEVIRVEPRHHSSWTALATCYEQLGDGERALQIEIMAAHLKGDAEQWQELAQRSRETNHIQQALYCYKKACRLDPESIDAYWELAMLYKEMGNVQQAASTFQALLKTHPHNISIINQLLPLASELRNYDTIIRILQGSFEHYQESFPSGPPPVQTLNQDPDSPKELYFQDYHIVALADLLLATGKYDQAIKVIKQGARWLQGRYREKHLDSASDDREFDADGIVRSEEERLLSGPAGKYASYHLDVNMRHRLARARIKHGDIKEARLHCSVVLRENSQYFAELFLELADAFVEKSLHLDALPIYERVMKDGADMSPTNVMNMGSCYRVAGKLSKAENMYEMVLDNDPDDRNAKLKLAEIYEAQGEPKRALALVYEVIDARKKSTEQASSAPDSTSVHEGGLIIGAPKSTKRHKCSTTKPGDGPRRPTRAEIQQREKERTTEIAHAFATLTEIGDAVNIEDEATLQMWMSLAITVVDDFREARELFPASRYALTTITSKFKGLEADEETIASRLEAEINAETEQSTSKAKDFVPVSYRNVSFEDWLKIIVQYSLLIASRGQTTMAQEILNHVAMSYVFSPKYDPEARVVLLIAQMAVAAHAGNLSEVTTVGRTLTNENQFNNEPLRIMLACLNPGLRGTDAFIERTVNKWSLRVNRTWDLAVETRKRQEKFRASAENEGATERDMNAMDVDESDTGKANVDNVLRWNEKQGRWVPSKNQKEFVEVDEEDKYEDAMETSDKARQPTKLPGKRSPLARFIQGSMLNASKTNHGALYYLFEAHEVQPDDPLLCLSIAVSALGRSMGRRSDNRQHLIVQGVAFLEEYRKYRGKDNLATQEVEYNFGRFFHQLNIGSFAATHYKRVLSLAEEWQQDHPDDPGYGPEAAYNLSLLHILSGSTQLAKNLYKRWLSL